MMIDIQNIVMDGTDKSFVVPANVASIAFHAKGGTIVMKKTEGGAGWTFDDKDKESVDTRAVAGEQLYFNGEAGGTVIMEIRMLLGVLS
ncbi:MAG: hypothetical protein Q7T18_02810 [Sedimentisphaerales bacterium]|nr:hypothetical protein [Sedimentisphaerales bacterium]